MSTSLVGKAFTVALVLVCAALFPRWWFGHDADALIRGEPDRYDALARGVTAAVESRVDSSVSLTGTPRFDGEWFMILHQMAALGLGQLVLERPERRAEYLPTIATCVGRLQTHAATAFGKDAWGRGGFDDLASDRGHAYLGYSNLAFGMLRLLDPGSSIAPLHDRITTALVRRLSAAPHAIIETYPSEAYPADVAAVAASIALYDRATGQDHRALLERWLAAFEERYVDPASGLLYQTVDARSGKPLGPARASGTAIAVYFLSFVDRGRARALYTGVSRLHARLLGFGGIREYPPNIAAGFGDIDSGPLFFGVSASASAFALAGAKLSHDVEIFTALIRTATLVGAPLEIDGRRRFVTGGTLGTAIVLAALTAGMGAP